MRKYGSYKVHLLLWCTTIGIGNVWYAYKSAKNFDPTEDIPDPETPQEKEVVGARGKNGAIAVMDDKVVIEHNGKTRTKLTQGIGKGKKEIWFKSLSGIEYKEPNGTTAGYLQLAQTGRDEEDGGVVDAVTDENTVMFNSGQTDAFTQVKRAIEERAN